MFGLSARTRYLAGHNKALSLIYTAALLVPGLLLPGTNATATTLSLRSLDGSGNNLANPAAGETNTPLLRLLNNAYEDGVSSPRGGDPSSLPSARAISNAVAHQVESKPSSAGINSWFWQWGQFIDHDISLTESAPTHEAFNIPVPAGDAYFTPGSSINLDRSIYDESSGVRQQVNQIGAYIDGSMVYGSDTLRATELRANDGTGRLKTTLADNGEVLMPYNTANLENAMSTSDAFFIAGDVRANEQLGLTATHTLFVREHNRIADELATRLNDGVSNPDLVQLRDNTIAEPGNGVDNNGDFIYEAARKVVGAQIQKITYNEFLPLLLGDNALGSYSNYDATIDAGISNEFSTAAFRLGHTMLPSSLYRAHELDPNTPLAPIELRDAFFNPAEIQLNGVDSLLIGMFHQASQEVDTQIIDDVRNFLFGPPGAGGFDLASLNIQRGRDHGLPGYNQARTELGLGAASSFLEMTGGDQILADAFAAVYGSVDDVDLWIGGLAESHYNGGLVGETFHRILQDQFLRLRDGDRFFFMGQDEMTELLTFDPLFMEDTSLSNIIERNTHYDGMPASAFLLNQVSAPATLFLMMIGLASLWCHRRRMTCHRKPH